MRHPVALPTPTDREPILDRTFDAL